ncbi:MAG TPA: ABC transporter permease, partial [Enterococcus sp.]|nr:ABC transporter permease [Enterococcus sp.]
RGYELPEQQEKEIKVVSQSEFDQLSLPQSTLQLVQVKDFQANLEPIKALATQNKTNNPSLQKVEYSNQKYEMYEGYNS